MWRSGSKVSALLVLNRTVRSGRAGDVIGFGRPQRGDDLGWCPLAPAPLHGLVWQSLDASQPVVDRNSPQRLATGLARFMCLFLAQQGNAHMIDTLRTRRLRTPDTKVMFSVFYTDGCARETDFPAH